MYISLLSYSQPCPFFTDSSDPKIPPGMMNPNLLSSNFALACQDHFLRSQRNQLASIMMIETAVDWPTFDILTLLQAQRIIVVNVSL